MSSPRRGSGVGGETELTDAQVHRYARHIILDEVGGDGQRKLLDASVLIVGAGGLGSPAALYLAAAGVGRIGLADDDTVDLTNLQRQILHKTSDLGRRKVDSGADTLHGINPDTDVVRIAQRLDESNAQDLVSGWDVVLDGSDNFETRYVLSDSCYRTAIPLVHGAIFRFEGQVTTIAPPGPCYRCLFPSPPPEGSVPNCQQAGVFGVLPGVVGTLQATEAVKLLCGLGEPLIGRLLLYDALEMRFQHVRVARDESCTHGRIEVPT